MDLKYDIYSISNAAGSGEQRKYVRLQQQEAMTASELEATIQNRCSLTKGDVAAVLKELHDIAVQEFSSTSPKSDISRSPSVSRCQRTIPTRRLPARRCACVASTSAQRLVSFKRWAGTCATWYVRSTPASRGSMTRRKYGQNYRNISRQSGILPSN